MFQDDVLVPLPTSPSCTWSASFARTHKYCSHTLFVRCVGQIFVHVSILNKCTSGKCLPAIFAVPPLDFSPFPVTQGKNWHRVMENLTLTHTEVYSMIRFHCSYSCFQFKQNKTRFGGEMEASYHNQYIVISSRILFSPLASPQKAYE